MLAGIDAIAAVAAQAGTAVTAAGDGPVTAPDTFARLFEQQLGELNAKVGAAENALRGLAAGKPLELHEVMISLEQARISVQTFVQVRNKLIESYQDLMRMQL